MNLPPEIRDIVLITLAAVLLPGLAMLGLARWAYGATPPGPLRREKAHITRLGWGLVALEVVFLVSLLLVLPSGAAQGGLGAMGNPLAALALPAYLWVVAPCAVLALLVVGMACALRRWRGA